MPSSTRSNIGAYGVEFKDVFHACEAISTDDGSQLHFSWEDCEFAYRDSVFKNRLKKQGYSNMVYLKLAVSLLYNGVWQFERCCGEPWWSFIKEYPSGCYQHQAGKLPDPVQFGNAGGFFKNPVVDTSSWGDNSGAV